MNKSKFKNILKESLFPLGIFAFVIILLIIIFSVNGLALFSHDGLTIISYDMQSQYVAYLRSFKAMLDGDGIIDVYTSQKVFGGDFLSIYTYYLASPFNYLLKFTSYSDIPLFFMWTNIVEMALAGVFMYLLLRFTFKKIDYISIGFAVSYALVSYSFVYSSNFMWLDAVMILPVIILGLKMIDENHNPVVYIIGLTYALITGWYIGALVAIFVGLFFIALLIAHPKGKKLERTFFIGKFFFFSLLAGIASATNWMVAFSHLAGTKATSSLPTSKPFSFSMFFSGMLENGYSSRNITVNAGYMPIFISIVLVALMVMFFFNRGYSLRRRLAYLGIIVIYFVFSMYTNLNALMHGGREPTWFPTRYAFVISFFFCYLGALQFAKKDDTPIWGILAPLLMIAIVLPIVLNVENTFVKENRYYTLSVVSLLLYIFTILLILADYILRKKHISIKFQNEGLSIILATLAIISAYRGGDKIVRTNVNSNMYQKYETYLRDDAYTKYIKVDDELAQRATLMVNRPGNYNSIDNNPMFYNFDGLSNYSSSSKKNVESYVTRLGFHYNGYFANYSYGSTASMNSLLGVKYFFDDTKRNDPKPIFVSSSPFTKEVLNEEGNIVKYENSYALPLAFSTIKAHREGIQDSFEIPGKSKRYYLNDFEYQNQIFKTFTGLDKDIFTPLDVSSITLGNGISYTEDEFGIRRYTCSGSSKTITFNFSYSGTIDENHNFYFGEKNLVTAGMSFDYKDIGENSYWRKGIRGIPLKDNAEHKLRYTFRDQTVNNKEIIPELYVEDINVLKEHLDILKVNEFKLSKYHTHNTAGLKGTVNVVDSTNMDLQFTLPVEKEIHVYVDDKPFYVYKRWNIFAAIDLSALSVGEHEIKIVYEDKVYGVMSVISPIVFVMSISLSGTYYFYKWIFKKKEDIEK